MQAVFASLRRKRNIKRYASFSSFLVFLMSNLQIMRKEYIVPKQVACKLLSEKIISSSDKSISSKGFVDEITYGGTDVDGSLEPGVKANTNLWDNEW